MSEQRTDWPMVALLIAGGIVAAIQVGKVPPLIPILRQELTMSLVASGWLASSIQVMGACAGLVCGSLADRMGRRRAVLIACAIGLLASSGGALSPDGTLLLAFRVAESVSFVFLVVALPGLIVAASALPDLRLSVGLWSIYMPTGVTIAMIAVPLLAPLIGWRPLWWGAGLVMAVYGIALALAFRSRPPPPASPENQRAGIADFLAVLRRPGCWLLGLSFGFYTFQWFAVATWLPTFAQADMGVTVTEAGLLAALVVAANIVGCVGGSFVLHRGVPRWMILAAVNGMLGLLSLGIFDPGLPGPLRVGMAVVFSAFGGMLPAAVLAAAPMHAPHPRAIGAVNGLIVQGSTTGAVIGPPVIALAVSSGGNWGEASWVLTLSGAFGVCAALVLRLIERHLLRNAESRA
ncbi:CynX/NimT family MFS transporter [Marinibaculum pumilum]|uniref:CynX/NimT family MFS transporter n=1 Tax=Marinibaculum pumilum TaxID=1766165 RepID=A0ABV7KVZ9_9PROT